MSDFGLARIRRRPPQTVVPGFAPLDTFQRWRQSSISGGQIQIKLATPFCV
jgi:hypothetical protein